MEKKLLKLGDNESVAEYGERVQKDIGEHTKIHGVITADANELADAVISASTHANKQQRSHLSDLLNLIDKAYHTGGMDWSSFRTILRKATKEKGIALDVYPVRDALPGSRYPVDKIKLTGIVKDETPPIETPPVDHTEAGNQATVTATGQHGMELAESMVNNLIRTKEVSAEQLLVLVANKVDVTKMDEVLAGLGYVSIDAADVALHKAVSAERKAHKAELAAAKRRSTAAKKRAANKTA